MAIRTFPRPYDYEPNVTKAVIEGEEHIIPATYPHDIYLHHIPRRENPSTVRIDGYIEVDGPPGPGQYRVHYIEENGMPLGRVEFHAADAGKTVAVSYHACGTVIWAEDRDGRPNVTAILDALEHVQDALEHVQDAGGIGYASAVAGFTPSTVKAALDALAGVRIVEMGSNSNGEYVRFENGWQVCWHRFNETRSTTTARGALYEDDVGKVWTYPAAFAVNPAPFLEAYRQNDDNFALTVGKVFNLSATSLTYKDVSTNAGSSLARTDALMAIGRWK